MPVMSKVERASCRSAPWRSFTGRIVLPWVLGDTELRGQVLEIGSGAGANAQVLLEGHADMQLTATDLDPVMVASARRRLASHGRRVTVTEADTTVVSFDDDRFDAVVSLLMLHHVIDWRDALTEIARVLRPGGTLVGYDLTDRLTARAVHLADRSPHRLLDPDDLADGLSAAGFTAVQVDTGLLGTVARFSATAPVVVLEVRSGGYEGSVRTKVAAESRSGSHSRSTTWSTGRPSRSWTVGPKSHVRRHNSSLTHAASRMRSPRLN